MDETNLTSQELYRQLGLGNLITYPYGLKKIIVNTDTHKLSINNTVYKFTDIIDVESVSEIVHSDVVDAILNSQRKSNTSDVIKRSIIGGAVAGPLGAVVGGATASKIDKNEHPSAHKEITKLIVSVNNLEKPTEVIEAGRDDYVDEKEFIDITNFFKILLTNNRNGKNTSIENRIYQHSSTESLEDKQQALSQEQVNDMLARARKLKEDIKDLYFFEDNTKNTVNKIKSIYAQVQAFGEQSAEAQFYSSYFDSFTETSSPDAIKKQYIEHSRTYLEYIATRNNFEGLLNEFIDDSYNLAKYIDWHYLQPVRASYFMLLELGDMVDAMFGGKCRDESVALWEKAIAVHHEAGDHKREDFRKYIDKIKTVNQNYIEPKNQTGCLSSILVCVLVFCSITCGLLLTIS